MSSALTIDTEVSDLIWERMRHEAEKVVRAEPSLARLVAEAILSQASLEAALAGRLAHRLAGEIGPETLRAILTGVIAADASMRRSLRFDILAILDRDPATTTALDPILHFKGFQALQTHRFAHALWSEGRRDLALHLQHRASEIFQVDIHPAVPIGAGMFIDHATGIAIGRTVTIGENVSILQGVILGPDLGAASGSGHLRIGRGVMIGAGARVLGPIEIGHCSRVGAGSLVLEDVPANVTVAGSPARILGYAGCAEPSRRMDQIFYDVGL
ncbi:serine acetyltransferase [Aureimonas sp. AU12]|uniref:serine O-acetyltransferase n=1 Tax=Aureimonas sp. AU12 TaxID=1638161 RepID=UPI0007810F1D|nr:serine acetyltransferase [Aureimonas sp. AU12]